MTITPSRVARAPAWSMRRVFTGSGRDCEAGTSKRSCTAVATLLTFWPPGPELRTKLNSNSESGIESVDVISSCSGIGWKSVELDGGAVSKNFGGALGNGRGGESHGDDGFRSHGLSAGNHAVISLFTRLGEEFGVFGHFTPDDIAQARDDVGANMAGANGVAASDSQSLTNRATGDGFGCGDD